MSKKNECLEVEFLNSNIPDYMERYEITRRDYENKKVYITDFAWPRTKKEQKRYIKRILKDAKKGAIFYDPELNGKLTENIEDGKNRNYLDLTVDIDKCGEPRTYEESVLFWFRHWMESVASEYYRLEMEEDYYDD